MNARNRQALGESWTNAGRNKFAQYLAALANTFFPEDKEILHRDHVPLHAGNLGDANHLACSVAETTYLDHQVKGRRNLSAHGVLRDIQIGHGYHRLQPAQSIARSVG